MISWESMVVGLLVPVRLFWGSVEMGRLRNFSYFENVHEDLFVQLDPIENIPNEKLWRFLCRKCNTIQMEHLPASFIIFCSFSIFV